MLNKLKGWNNRLIIIGIFDIGFSGDIFYGPHSLNESTSPNTAMGCWQCLSLSVVQLKGKHCKKNITVMGL